MAARSVLVVVFALLFVACSADAPPPAPEATTAPAAAPSSAPASPAVGPVTPPTTDEDMIKSAMSAAPESVSSDATIIAMDEKMQVRTLRKGSNMWTCMPDGPSPGVDPMCMDPNALEWAQAWMARKDPPADKMGFGYMLMGGSDASNTDPFATTPASGQSWVDTGPHVMVLNIGNRFAGYPTTPDDPKRPFIMYPNTPYAHLMIPVR